MSWAFWNWDQYWLVWVEGCWIFLESQHSQNYCFWGWMCVLTCRLQLKWSWDKSLRKVCTCLCVLMMWSDCSWRWSLERVQIFYFRWGTKNWVFCNYQVEKGVWYKLFVNLVYTLRRDYDCCFDPKFVVLAASMNSWNVQRYFCELVKNSCIPIEYCSFWGTNTRGMNICSLCSGDFAFSKHLCLGSLEDVTKGQLSLTNSS